jgi:hypothetical protein
LPRRTRCSSKSLQPCTSFVHESAVGTKLRIAAWCQRLRCSARSGAPFGNICSGEPPGQRPACPAGMLRIAWIYSPRRASKCLVATQMPYPAATTAAARAHHMKNTNPASGSLPKVSLTANGTIVPINITAAASHQWDRSSIASSVFLTAPCRCIRLRGRGAHSRAGRA